MPNRLFKSALLATSMLACMATPSVAIAQEGGADQTVDTENRLGTVTVTSQKREENLQDVPIAAGANPIVQFYQLPREFGVELSFSF